MRVVRSLWRPEKADHSKAAVATMEGAADVQSFAEACLDGARPHGTLGCPCRAARRPVWASSPSQPCSCSRAAEDHDPPGSECRRRCCRLRRRPPDLTWRRPRMRGSTVAGRGGHDTGAPPHDHRRPSASPGGASRRGPAPGAPSQPLLGLGLARAPGGPALHVPGAGADRARRSGARYAVLLRSPVRLQRRCRRLRRPPDPRRPHRGRERGRPTRSRCSRSSPAATTVPTPRAAPDLCRSSAPAPSPGCSTALPARR